jgi:hypothetical protein
MKEVAVSGTRGAEIGKEAVATTGLSEFVLESVAFWQATSTTSPAAKVTKGRREGRSNFMGEPLCRVQWGRRREMEGI